MRNLFYKMVFLVLTAVMGLTSASRLVWCDDGAPSTPGEDEGATEAVKEEGEKKKEPPPPPKKSDVEKPLEKNEATGKAVGGIKTSAGTTVVEPSAISALNAATAAASKANGALNKKFQSNKIDPAYFMATKQALTDQFTRDLKNNSGFLAESPELELSTLPRVPVSSRESQPSLPTPSQPQGLTQLPPLPEGNGLKSGPELINRDLSTIRPDEIVADSPRANLAPTSETSKGSGDAKAPVVQVTQQRINSVANSLDSIHSLVARKAETTGKEGVTGTRIIEAARGIESGTSSYSGEEGDVWAQLSEEEREAVKAKMEEIAQSLKDEMGEEDAVAKIEELKTVATDPKSLAELMAKVRDEVLVSKGKAPRKEHPIVFTKAAGMDLAAPSRNVSSVDDKAKAGEGSASTSSWKLYVTILLIGLGVFLSRKMRKA